jgi:hypothetical protein
VLEGRYRLLMRALWELRHSRRTRWGLGLGSAAFMLLLAFLAVRHFATTSWPLSRGEPGLLVAAGLLLLLAQALKAFGWARLFTNRERPSPLALVAGNGGAALVGVVLPGRFDDAMRIAVVRRYPGCPAGLRAISLSLVMLGLIDSAALAPLAAVAVAFPGAGVAARAALAVVAGGGIAAAAVIVALPRLAGGKRASARSDWATRSHSRCCFSAPAPQPQRYRSAPAGAATQAGAGTAALAASGVGASQALAAAVSVGALGVFCGAAVLLFAVAWRTGRLLLPARTAH